MQNRDQLEHDREKWSNSSYKHIIGGAYQRAETLFRCCNFEGLSIDVADGLSVEICRLKNLVETNILNKDVQLKNLIDKEYDYTSKIELLSDAIQYYQKNIDNGLQNDRDVIDFVGNIRSHTNIPFSREDIINDYNSGEYKIKKYIEGQRQSYQNQLEEIREQIENYDTNKLNGLIYDIKQHLVNFIVAKENPDFYDKNQFYPWFLHNIKGLNDYIASSINNPEVTYESMSAQIKAQRGYIDTLEQRNAESEKIIKEQNLNAKKLQQTNDKLKKIITMEKIKNNNLKQKQTEKKDEIKTAEKGKLAVLSITVICVCIGSATTTAGILSAVGVFGNVAATTGVLFGVSILLFSVAAVGFVMFKKYKKEIQIMEEAKQKEQKEQKEQKVGKQKSANITRNNTNNNTNNKTSNNEMEEDNAAPINTNTPSQTTNVNTSNINNNTTIDINSSKSSIGAPPPPSPLG